MFAIVLAVINLTSFFPVTGCAGNTNDPKNTGDTTAITSDTEGNGGENPIRRTDYSIYNPNVAISYVQNAAQSNVKYNHCANIAYFKDRFFVLWNGSPTAKEGSEGQLIYFSTSSDAQTWREAEILFSNPAYCKAPLTDKIIQWQPVLLEYDDKLLCFFALADGEMYMGTLSDPDQKWELKPVTLMGGIKANIDGKEYSMYTQQKPIITSTGRIIVPVTL